MSARILVPLLEPLDVGALDVAAAELLVHQADELDREELARRVIRAYLCALAFTTPANHSGDVKPAA